MNNFSRALNILCVLLGGVIAIYAQAGAKQNEYVLIIGIVLLMFGIYRISRNVPSKFENQEEESSLSSDLLTQ